MLKKSVYLLLILFIILTRVSIALIDVEKEEDQIFTTDTTEVDLSKNPNGAGTVNSGTKATLPAGTTGELGGYIKAENGILTADDFYHKDTDSRFE